MLFVQIGNMWVNAQYITSIHRYDESLEIHFGEEEGAGILTLRDPAAIDAFLHWLTEKAPNYVVI